MLISSPRLHPSRVSPPRGKTSGGFTLLEMLVVITIIGTLSSIVITNLSSARAKSRDATRLQYMENMRDAIELYYRDNGVYPISQCYTTGGALKYYAAFYGGQSGGVLCASQWAVGTDHLADVLRPYIPNPPNDSFSKEIFYRSVDGREYCIDAYGVENMKNFTSSMKDAGRCGTLNSNGQCSGVNSVYISNTTGVPQC